MATSGTGFLHLDEDELIDELRVVMHTVADLQRFTTAAAELVPGRSRS